MPSPKRTLPAHFAILLIAEIKAAVEDFERGETNAFDTVDAVIAAVAAYRAGGRPRRDAA